MKTRHRAYAYITHENRLLLFTHPKHPEAGIQVPAGSVEEGEEPGDAAMREAEEETNLKNLKFERFLDQDTRDMNDCGTDELQYRWFYHLSCSTTPEEEWTHGEFSKEGVMLHQFDFFWRDIESLPKLVADYDDKIDLLKDSLNQINQ